MVDAIVMATRIVARLARPTACSETPGADRTCLTPRHAFASQCMETPAAPDCCPLLASSVRPVTAVKAGPSASVPWIFIQNVMPADRAHLAAMSCLAYEVPGGPARWVGVPGSLR